MGHQFVEGVRLQRTEENTDGVEALVGRLGGRAGLDVVLADLNRTARRTPWALGRAVERAFTWDRPDRVDHDWWPQGISTSADASDAEVVGDGRRVLVVTWYSKSDRGSRLTFLDLDTLRYRHVLLVVPSFDDAGALRLEPLKVHAGGIVWAGPYLHVAATSRGFFSCRPDDILRVPDEVGAPDVERLGDADDRIASFGYRYVLPVRFGYTAYADEGHERLRYSFLSLDRSASPPELVAGEYGRHQQTTRLARYPLDPETLHLLAGDDGFSRPVLLDDGGVVQMQGAAVARGDYYVTASKGPWTPGSMYVGQPGAFRRHRWATPIGPEDIAYWPSTDSLWSLTEHPRRRWVFSMRRAWFD